MVDLHTHLLPGVDDGPPDLDGSLALAEAMVAAGVTTAAATPHIDHLHGVAPREVAARVEELQAALDARGLPLRVVRGGEVATTRTLDLGTEELAAVRLGDGGWLLLECPLIPGALLEPVAAELRSRGFALVLAHPERSPVLGPELERLTRLVRQGCLSSITDASLRGRFGRVPQERALDMLERGLVHNVASDAHDAERRKPGLTRGLASAEDELPGIAGLARWLTHDLPAAVLAGAPLPPRPPVELERRGRRRFWRRGD